MEVRLTRKALNNRKGRKEGCENIDIGTSFYPLQSLLKIPTLQFKRAYRHHFLPTK